VVVTNRAVEQRHGAVVGDAASTILLIETPSLIARDRAVRHHCGSTRAIENPASAAASIIHALITTDSATGDRHSAEVDDAANSTNVVTYRAVG
jgi:hypothetical protein